MRMSKVVLERDGPPTAATCSAKSLEILRPLRQMWVPHNATDVMHPSLHALSGARR